MKKLLRIFGILCLLILVSAGFFAVYVFFKIPSEKEIRGCLITTMYQVNLCPGSKDYVPLKSISSYLQKTVVLTEDSAFFQHDGFDWKAIEENAKKNLEKRQYAKGGSTISQQLAKNMFLYKDKTLFRKGLEALITKKIEKTLKKNEILERYLNVVEFGKDIYGIKQAASFYFKKAPAQLDVVESAFLAMILPSPVKYSQSYFRKELTPFAHKRLKRIINDMYQYSRITDEEYNVAIIEVDRLFSTNMASDFLDEIENSGANTEGDGIPPGERVLDESDDLKGDEDSFF